MIKFNDRVKIGETRVLDDGYLVATARVARTGVQQYLASEIGDIAYSAGFKPNDVVRINRPESEVFAEDTLKSITRVPVTVDHPKENVTAENWAKFAVGDVGDSFAKDGEWIVVNPMIKDSDAIKAASTTHKEISMGYTANIVEAKDKAIADFDMVDIKMNHLALVPRGRAGSQARIGDSWGANPINDNQTGSTPTNQRGGHMTTKTVVLGDKAVQVLVEDAAEVERFKADSAKALSDAQSAHKTAIEAKDSEIGELKVKVADAEKALADAKAIDVDALVAARTELVAQVKAIDSAIEVSGKSDAELRKAAVIKKLGDEAVADSNDAEISGMFKAITKTAAKHNPVVDAFSSGVKPIGDNNQIGDAQKAYLARLTRSKEA